MKSIFIRIIVGTFSLFLLTFTARATVVYVNGGVSASGVGTSWSTAYKTLQEALVAANGSSAITEIWVQAGTYYPTAVPIGSSTTGTTARDYAFKLQNNLTIYGGFAGTEVAVTGRVPGNTTILSGDIGIVGIITDNCYHVVVAAGNNSTAKLDGLTISGGNANGGSTIAVSIYSISEGYGGGMYVNSSSPGLNNCIFTANTTVNDGGGMYSTSSSPVLTGCTFSSNSGFNGGALEFINGSAALSACTISSCTASGSGGGISLIGATSALADCIISSCSAASLGGAVYSYGYTTFTGCTFTGNTAYRGGGLYLSTYSYVVTNCRLINNTGGNSAGGMEFYGNGTTISISKTVFSGNTVISGIYGSGGGYQQDLGTATITNCIFNANAAAGTQDDGGGGIMVYGGTVNVGSSTFYSNASASTIKPGSNAICAYSVNSSVILNVINSIVWGDSVTQLYNASATITAAYCNVKGGYTGTGNISTDLGFVNAAVPAGADGIWATTDDGLALLSCSQAINAGATPSPAIPTDILGNTRVGVYDMGAYEYTGIPTNAVLATAAATATAFQTGTTSYGACNSLIATILSSGTSPVAGSVTAKVYVQSTAANFNNQPYVRRYYDIRPSTAPNTATATITLYFLQSDFDNYNLARGSYPSLPINAADVAGYRYNLRITQQHGISTSGTGAPGTYTGWSGSGRANILITPASVTYNTMLARWEVTFPVTGFSGFFAHTGIYAPLPLKLLRFTACKADAARNRIDWTTATEDPGTSFDVERSSDGRSYATIGQTAGKGGDAAYTTYDQEPLSGTGYYRLKITEADGNGSYSGVAVIRSDSKSGAVIVSPIPASRSIRIRTSDASLTGQTAVIYNMQGLEMYRAVLAADQYIDISSWAAGIYSLRLPAGEVIRLVKE